MTNATIGYQNYLDENLTASDDPAAAPVANCYDWLLFDYWQPAAATSHTLDVDIGAGATNPDYFAFYSSDLYLQAGATVKIYAGASAPATNLIATITPTTRGPKMKLFSAGGFRYWRMTFATTASYSPKIQLAALGVSLELERGVMPGFTPAALGSRNVPVNSVSRTGLFLGRSLEIAAVDFSLPLTVLSAAWIRANWPALLAHLEQYPFWIMPEPDSYDGEAVLAWTKGAIKAPAYSHAAHLGLTLNLQAFI